MWQLQNKCNQSNQQKKSDGHNCQGLLDNVLWNKKERLIDKLITVENHK